MLSTRLILRRIRAFTLVELMVTLAIVSVLLAIGAPAFRTWLVNGQVRTVAESVQNGLQIARNEAIRRNCNVSFTMNIVDSSWTVIAYPGSGSETVDSRSGNEASVANLTIAVSNSSTATFNGLGRLDNTSPLNTVDISSAAGDKSLRVQVGTGGQIRLCDPSSDVPANDPRKCT